MGNRCCSAEVDKNDELEMGSTRGRNKYEKKKKRSTVEPLRISIGEFTPIRNGGRQNKGKTSADLNVYPLFRKSELGDIKEQTRVVKQGKKLRK